MKTKTQTAILTTFVVLLLVGVAAANDGTYDSSVTLENKDANWTIIADDASATVDFNAAGDEFEWHAYGKVPNFVGPVAECYALIYYADEDDRFNNWGGDNPGKQIGTFVVDACDGSFNASGSSYLNMNMPESPDFNIDPDPWNEYCGINDTYDHCCGAKLWIVPCSNYTEPAMTDWVPANYLFETDLIWYDDTDHDVAPEVPTWWMSGPNDAGERRNITVIVRDYDGVHDLEDMNVTIDLTEYGVDEVTTLAFNGTLDCIRAEYIASVVMTVATDGEVCENITAIDPSGETGVWNICFEVDPGPCAYMELQNYEDECGDGELKVKALAHLWDCNTCPVMWWYDYGMFYPYMLSYTVHLYDEYDNYIGPLDEVDDCCEDYTATLDEGSSASLKIHARWWNEDSRIVIVNEFLPGTTTLTVHCVCDEGNGVPDLVQEVEFLNPISQLSVATDDDVIYETDECSDDDELINVSATILDALGNPILMECVDVDLYMDCAYVDTEKTDENGTATFVDVCVSGYVAGDEVVFRAESECREGSIIIPVSEPVLVSIEINDPESPVDCGDGQQLTYKCFNPNGNEMCCPECCICPPYNIEWTADELGDVNATGFFTAVDSGTSVVEVNISGITDTAEIVIDCPVNCTDKPTICQTYPYSFVVTSGTVELAGDFTAPGYACVEAIGDPIAEFGNDTRGAIVDMNDTATESVMLNLNGVGDTWKYNVSTEEWSKYDDGSVTEVSSGTYALVVPGVDPVCTDVVIATEDPINAEIGDTVTFTVSCTDQYSDPIDCSELMWTSDNETVGTMDGLTLTTLALGITNVTATGCGDSNSIQVTVSDDVTEKGDFDGDGVIGFDDFVEFAGAYGAATCEDSNYDATADFDDDCDVDFDDFVEFAGVYTN